MSKVNNPGIFQTAGSCLFTWWGSWCISEAGPVLNLCVWWIWMGSWSSGEICQTRIDHRRQEMSQNSMNSMNFNGVSIIFHVNCWLLVWLCGSSVLCHLFVERLFSFPKWQIEKQKQLGGKSWKTLLPFLFENFSPRTVNNHLWPFPEWTLCDEWTPQLLGFWF